MTDGRFARATGQQCDGLHGWKPALVRIVERSHLDCRKPLAPLSSFHPCHRSPLQRRRAPIERATVSHADPHHGGCAARCTWSAREIELQALATLAALAQISTPSAAHFLKSHQLLVQKFAADRNRQKRLKAASPSAGCSDEGCMRATALRFRLMVQLHKTIACFHRVNYRHRLPVDLDVAFPALSLESAAIAMSVAFRDDPACRPCPSGKRCRRYFAQFAVCSASA
jgi:hypothetical protein